MKWVKKVPKKKRNLNATSRVNPPANVPKPLDDDSIPPFHVYFPFELQYKENGENKLCWFTVKEDMQKHIARYKLKAKEYTIKKTQPKNNVL